MKMRFEKISVNFTLSKGVTKIHKCQQLPISRETLIALKNNEKESQQAVEQIIRSITFLCGFDNYEIQSIEGKISGGDIFE